MRFPGFKRKKQHVNAVRTDKQPSDALSPDAATQEEEKSKEIEQLKQLEQYRRDFFGNVSHELKTPLFTIQGYVLTLLDGGLDDPSVNREYLKRAEKSIERLIRIVEDLDEIAQLDSGQIKLNITRFNIVVTIKEAIELLEMKARKRKIDMVLNHSDKSVDVEGDQERILQVLTNIIENSIRYGKDEGKMTIDLIETNEHILVEITDNGTGIDAVELPRVFERFYRTPRGRAGFSKGKGLGLAIVKHIIEAHGQTINVRSTIGVGTTFGFTLKKSISSGR